MKRGPAPLTPARQLRQLLRRARLRARQVLAASWLLRVATPLLCALVLPALVLRLVGWWLPPLSPLALVAGLGLGCALVAALWPLADRMMLASLDRRLDLKDRLTTAGWLLAHPRHSAMDLVALEDGLVQARAARPAEAYTFPAARRWRTGGLGLVVLLAATLAPIPPLLLSVRARQERAELRQQAAQIKPVAKDLTQAAQKSHDPEARRAARRLERLHQDLLHGRLNRKQALLRLGDLQRDLERLQRQQDTISRGRQAAQKLERDAAGRLSKAAAQAAQESRRQNQPELARKLDELAKQARRNPQTAALKQGARDLKAAAASLGMALPEGLDLPLDMAQALSQPSAQMSAEQMKKLREQLAKQLDKMTPQQRQALAKELQRLAQAAQQAGAKQCCAELCEASQCLRQGNCQGARMALLGRGNQAARRAALAAAAQAAGRGMGVAMNCNNPSSGGACAGSGSSLGAGGRGQQDAIPKDAPGASLYASRRTDVQPTPRAVHAAIGDPRGGMIAGQVRGAPDQMAPSRVPYYEVVGGYSRAAEEALRRDEVPASYRSTVRDYFAALQGNGPAPKPTTGQTGQEQAP